MAAARAAGGWRSALALVSQCPPAARAAAWAATVTHCTWDHLDQTRILHLPLESRAPMPTRVAFAGAAALSAARRYAGGSRRRSPARIPTRRSGRRAPGSACVGCRRQARAHRATNRPSEVTAGHGRKSERAHHDSDARPLRRYCDARAHMQMGEPIGGLGNAGRGAS